MARCLNNLGEVLTKLHRYAEAEAQYERALALFEREDEPHSRYVEIVENNLGELALLERHPDVALAPCRRALDIATAASPGAPCQLLAFHRTCIGKALVDSGQMSAAVAPLELARTDREASPGGSDRARRHPLRARPCVVGPASRSRADINPK